MKKISKVFLYSVCCLFLIVSTCILVFPVETVFSTEIMLEHEKESFLSYIDITAVESEPIKKAISCFDVNEDNLIAIGSGNSERKTISVYTNGGTFQYGFQFNCTGSFGVEWSGRNLIIHFVRSDISAVVSDNGKIVDVFRIQNTSDNNLHWNNSIFSTKRIINDKEYLIKNDMGIINFFASTYSQLIMYDSNGTSRILYDVNRTQVTKFVVIAVFIFVLFAFISVIVKKDRELNTGRRFSVLKDKK